MVQLTTRWGCYHTGWPLGTVTASAGLVKTARGVAVVLCAAVQYGVEYQPPTLQQRQHVWEAAAVRHVLLYQNSWYWAWHCVEPHSVSATASLAAC